MNSNRFNYKLYIVSILISGVICLLVLQGLTKLSIIVTNSLNEKYMTNFINGDEGFSSPWYEDGLHIVDELFIEELDKINQDKNIFVLGSSVSSISVDKNLLTPDDDYSYRFMVCGNGCYRSTIILDNLIRENHEYTKNDIVKYEVSFSTFRSTNKTITESVIDKWGAYKVDDETLSVRKNSGLLKPLYEINENLIIIQNSWELFDSWREQRRDPQPKAVGNFKNYYFNYDTIASLCYMDDEMKDKVEAQLLDLNDKTTLVVELAPTPAGLQNTDYGKMLNEYIDERLIPLLEENNIAYYDIRNQFDDSEYGDGIHLGYEAKIENSKIINEEINKIINNK